ncbi:MAG: hypothetical protein HW403_895 [Dehalococcoidia bacterium]|nr:hypothetical protein [Dehalococcoidia bacterium]
MMSLGSLLLLVSLVMHTIAALSWVGSLLFNALVLALPMSTLSVERRLPILRWITLVLWLAILFLLPTGLWNMAFSPAVRPPPGDTASFGLSPSVTSWEQLEVLRDTPYGFALLIKHILVVISLGVNALVSFVVLPRMEKAASHATALASAGAGQEESGESPEVLSLRRQMLALATVNLVLGIFIVMCAVYMVYTLH